jgi:predicted RNase H-like HicB family nuclease
MEGRFIFIRGARQHNLKNIGCYQKADTSLATGGCFLMTFRFQVCFEPEEDGGYHAYVPALPGCHSYGRTIEEAERNIKEAILLYLDGLKKKHGLPLPSPQNQRR